jgi:hypothetical protein
VETSQLGKVTSLQLPVTGELGQVTGQPGQVTSQLGQGASQLGQVKE